MASSHYMNQCLFISSEVFGIHLKKFPVCGQAVILYCKFENHTFKFLPHLPVSNELTEMIHKILLTILKTGVSFQT